MEMRGEPKPESPRFPIASRAIPAWTSTGKKPGYSVSVVNPKATVIECPRFRVSKVAVHPSTGLCAGYRL